MSHGHRAATVAEAEHQVEARRPWTILSVMLMAQLMVILDISVVNVALPTMGKALDFTSSDYQWSVSAYVLLSGGLLLFGGRLADLLDRRTVFLAGLLVFTTASLVSATAWSAESLIVARGAQGAGAALLTPAALSILTSTYSGRQRDTALAVWGTIGSLGIALGVLFGGILTTALGWRAIFFINLPIGVLAAVQTHRLVGRGHRTGSARSIDIPGALTAVGGLVALVYGIEATRTHGWTSAQTLAALGAAVALLAAFAVIERRVSAPLVPPHTWRVRSLISASAVMAVITGAVVGTIFISSLFLQTVLGSSAIVTGLQILPLAATITLGAGVASHLLAKVSPKHLMIVGLLVVAAGALVLAALDDKPAYAADVLSGFVVLGLGVGLVFVTVSVTAMAGIPSEHSGLASGVLMTGHEIGAALGVAALAAVAGDLTVRGGLIDAFPRVFTVVAFAMVALAAFAAVAIPRQKAGTTHHARLH